MIKTNRVNIKKLILESYRYNNIILNIFLKMYDMFIPCASI